MEIRNSIEKWWEHTNPPKSRSVRNLTFAGIIAAYFVFMGLILFGVIHLDDIWGGPLSTLLVLIVAAWFLVEIVDNCSEALPERHCRVPDTLLEWIADDPSVDIIRKNEIAQKLRESTYIQLHDLYEIDRAIAERDAMRDARNGPGYQKMNRLSKLNEA